MDFNLPNYYILYRTVSKMINQTKRSKMQFNQTIYGAFLCTFKVLDYALELDNE